MAYPGNPPKGPAGFEKAPLTPDDFERLATAFRPSWELDEAPFTGAGALSTADIRALQGGGTHADVRATAQQAVSNGSHAPPKPAVAVDEPATKVIIDPAVRRARIRCARSYARAVCARAPQGHRLRRAVDCGLGPCAERPGAVRRELGAASSRVITVRPPRPRVETGPTFEPPGSKKGLWIGVGAAALALIGGVVWLASSGGSDKPVAAPQPAETVQEKVQPSIPPPPPEAVAATPKPQPTPAPAPPTPPVVAATSLPQAPPLPATPPPSHAAVAAAPAPHPVASPPPAPPKPATASRPKGPTIVRDVPF